MKAKLLTVALLVAGMCVPNASAQSRNALKINEVMVINETNLVDNYSNHGAWIELFNASFAPLEIKSVFLTDDPSCPTKYPVPLGDERTNIGKRQHVVFWADGKASRGTFHTNFTLDPNRPNWIGVYDADGITLIDSITVPVLQADQTYARLVDGEGAGQQAWSVRSGSEAPGDVVTPCGPNNIRDTNDNVAKFKQNDARGFGLTVTAMGIVFTALLLLSLCFYAISKFAASRLGRRKMTAQGIDATTVKRKERAEAVDSGEVIAAIAMALNQHLNAHDLESAILTINKTRKPYSPWSSHIYNLRQTPHRK